MPDSSEVSYRFEYRGRLNQTSYVQAERRVRHRGAVVTPEHFRNSIAYVCSLEEREHSSEADLMQRKLLTSLGLEPDDLFTRSRNRVDPIGRIALPHEFHPDRTGKSHVIMFPFGDEVPRRLEVTDYDTEHRILLKQARQLVAEVNHAKAV